ncbi:MAG: hypothetical protein JSU00_19490 [Acidobacteria bacterium]|nr:hypothetical protein [Acidobacteriota bacterium]
MLDGPSTLYSPVDAFSTRPLETTATVAIGAGDSTISVQSTAGFADTYGILSIDDELIVYTSKTASQFTGCQRGSFGTQAAGHASGATVRANIVAGFITALQSAVLAIENELGTAAARNYVLKDGAVTITGVKTFQDGAEFGSGAKAGTGLVRLPNNGAVKWRKADNSGDLGMALNANDHIAMDAIIDFAAGQTFGAFSYPDATTTSKGIVQIDPVGGLSVNDGVVGLAATAVTPGTYTKLTVDAKGRATAGVLLTASDLPAHTHVAGDIVSGSLPFTIQNNGTAVGTRRALNLIQGANMALSFADDAGNDRVTVTVALGSVPSHIHPESDIINLVTDLAAKAPLSHTHAAADVASGTLALPRGGTAADLSATGPGFLKQASAGAAVTVAALATGDLPPHTHTSAQISDATAAATASTVVLRDASAGANFGYIAANNLWAYADSHLQSVECGAYQTVGGAFENMLKFSEDFSAATWDKNGGTCTVTADAVLAPDGNQTADTVTANGSAGLIRQNIAGLAANGQYTFYIWLKVPSGTMTVSIGILDNGWTTWLAGPIAVTLTTSWQRFKVSGTLTGGATSLWVAVGHYSDGWTSGLSFHAWGACLQQGDDPKKAYARTWGYQASPVAAGIACGPVLVSAINSTDSPFIVRGPGSNLADHTLLQVTAAGELIVAGGAGTGYRLAELMGASNPSGWSGVIKVKNPAGVTAGFILLYSNP